MKKVETFQIVTLDNAHNTEVVIEQTDFNDKTAITPIYNCVLKDIPMMKTLTPWAIVSTFKNFNAFIDVGNVKLKFSMASWHYPPSQNDMVMYIAKLNGSVNDDVCVKAILSNKKNLDTFINKAFDACTDVLRLIHYANRFTSEVINRKDNTLKLSDLDGIKLEVRDFNKLILLFENARHDTDTSDREFYMNSAEESIKRLDEVKLGYTLSEAFLDLEMVRQAIIGTDGEVLLVMNANELLNLLFNNLKSIERILTTIYSIAVKPVCLKTVLYSNIANLRIGTSADIRVINEYIFEDVTRRIVKFSEVGRLTSVEVCDAIKPIVLKYISRTNPY